MRKQNLFMLQLIAYRYVSAVWPWGEFAEVLTAGKIVVLC